jgi:hypothetical protein
MPSRGSSDLSLKPPSPEVMNSFKWELYIRQRLK